MIMIIITMKVPAEKHKELSQTVASLLDTINTEKGCRRCDFFQAIEDESMLCLLEEWDSPSNFDNHLKSECFKVLRGAMNLLDKPCQITSFGSISTVEM